MPIRVQARVKGVKGYINAMRPTWLSNPYTLKYISNIDYNLNLYERYLRTELAFDKEFAKRFDSITKQSTIGCTCKPCDRCHVDIIIKVWNERDAKLKNERNGVSLE